MIDKLNVKSLNQALESLKTSWNKYKEVPGDEFVRDSVIQRFNIDTDFYNTIKQDLTPFLYD